MTMSDQAGVPRSFFESAYTGVPPWEIGRPQADVIRLAEAGGFKGSVLDVGCGSGENALFLARRGLEVWAIDAVPAAIDRGKAKAAEQGVKVNFQVGDALELPALGRTFDVVLDSGLFHVLSDGDRPRYLRGLAAVLKPRGLLHILCFSDQEPGTDGPRRIGERELITTFGRGWQVEAVSEARFETNLHPDGARAWLATFTRLGSF
jgi:ubiquinone/menaquinone biosynthesis C-methylase UbiE